MPSEAKASKSPTPPRRTDDTKRRRTQEQLLIAVDELLRVRSYDDIRVADIAKRAGIAVATFYTVYGDKAGAVGALFLSAYQPLDDQVRADILEDACPGETIFAAHMHQLATLVHSRRPLSRAFLRVYGSEILAKLDEPPENPMRDVCDASQLVLDRIAKRDLRTNRRLYIGDLGTLWTVDVMMAVLAHRPDDYLNVTGKLMKIYFPDVDLKTAYRMAGLIWMDGDDSAET
jgi:AcrR family transcriptional regulator